MLCLTVFNILMSYMLSLSQTKIAWTVFATMVVQLALIFAFHISIKQIINAVLISAISGLLLISVFVIKEKKCCQ